VTATPTATPAASGGFNPLEGFQKLFGGFNFGGTAGASKEYEATRERLRRLGEDILKNPNSNAAQAVSQLAQWDRDSFDRNRQAGRDSLDNQIEGYNRIIPAAGALSGIKTDSINSQTRTQGQVDVSKINATLGGSQQILDRAATNSVDLAKLQNEFSGNVIGEGGLRAINQDTLANNLEIARMNQSLQPRDILGLVGRIAPLFLFR
jgi:hypothetical protein